MIPNCFLSCSRPQIYYSATILQQAGLVETSTAIWYSVLVTTANFLFTVIGLWAVERFGRRRYVLSLSTSLLTYVFICCWLLPPPSLSQFCCVVLPLLLSLSCQADSYFSERRHYRLVHFSWVVRFERYGHTCCVSTWTRSMRRNRQLQSMCGALGMCFQAQRRI